MELETLTTICCEILNETYREVVANPHNIFYTDKEDNTLNPCQNVAGGRVPLKLPKELYYEFEIKMKKHLEENALNLYNTLEDRKRYSYYLTVVTPFFVGLQRLKQRGCINLNVSEGRYAEDRNKILEEFSEFLKNIKTPSAPIGTIRNGEVVARDNVKDGEPILVTVLKERAREERAKIASKNFESNLLAIQKAQLDGIKQPQPFALTYCAPEPSAPIGTIRDGELVTPNDQNSLSRR